jgi:methyl-accepting chemotaxis protein
MDRSTQQNAALVEQAAAAAAAMREQARQLSAAVGVFRVASSKVQRRQAARPTLPPATPRTIQNALQKGM